MAIQWNDPSFQSFPRLLLYGVDSGFDADEKEETYLIKWFFFPLNLPLPPFICASNLASEAFVPVDYLKYIAPWLAVTRLTDFKRMPESFSSD